MPATQVQAPRSHALHNAAEADSAPVLSVRNLQKHFTRSDGTLVPAIDGVSLNVHPGEFLVLLGPSGCGKTTLLRGVAGLEHPDSGTIEISGRTVYSSEERIDVATQHRSLSMVFQSYALWPNMNLFDNVAYPLQQRKMKKAQITSDVERICRLVGIGDILAAYPNHISGGQQQRVALARALVSGNALVLFDEPLSNVDAKVRKDLRVELTALQAKFGFAGVYVTHDQEDAMELGHKIAVLESGKVAQLADPRTLYSHPTSRYVATFVGSTNELVGEVRSIGPEGAVVETPLGPVLGARVAADVTVGDAAVAIFRPQHAKVSKDAPSSPNSWEVTYRTELFAGTHGEHVVTGEHVAYRVWSNGSVDAGSGDAVYLSAPPSEVHVFRP